MNNFNKFISVFIAVTMLLSMVGMSAMAEEVWDPFNGDTDVNIVYIGGSITLASNGWRDNVGNYIKSTYEKLVPGRTITNFNAGIGGTGSSYGVIRLAEDVMSKNPDLVFVEFAVNDGTDAINPSSVQGNQIVNSMEGIVRRLQSLPNPPMIVFVYSTTTIFNNISSIHSKIAKYYDIPEVDFKQLMLDLGYTPDTTAKTYNELTPRLRNLWLDLNHPNPDGYKIWSDYLIAEMTKNPQKYFRHPKLKANPINTDNHGSITAEYKTVKQIYDEGNISFSDTSGKGLTEGTDYYFEKNGDLAIVGGNKCAEVTFSGNILNAVMNVNAVDGTDFTYDIDNNKLTGSGSCFYSGESNATNFALGDGTHTIKFTVSPKRPDGGNGDIIRLKGFYLEKDETVIYPQSYPADVKINTYVEKEDNVPVPTEQSNYQDEIDVMKALGIMTGDENGNFLPKDGVTRAEFAQILSIILQLEKSDTSQAWYRQFLTGTDYDNTIKTPIAPTEDRFVDVDSEHWAKQIIEQITTLGYMSGATNDTFLPDEKITVNEVDKTFIKLLGYEVKANINGGYPVGYNHIASELKMLEGLNSFGDVPIKREEIAKLIYNCFDIEVLAVSSIGENTNYTTVAGETMLTKIMNMDKINGVITDNGITSRTDASTIDKDTVKIGSVIYSTSAKTKYIKDYVGRNVEMYVTNNSKENIEKVVYAKINSREDSLTFNVKDFFSITTGKITYFENDVLTNVNIANAPYIIYNGNAIKSIDDSYFDYDFGTVTLSSSTLNGTYDTIKTEFYKSWYVSDIDSGNFRLYNGSASNSDSDSNFMLELDPDNKSLFTLIYDNKGNEIDFSEINIGSVIDICRNNNYVKIIVTNNELKDSVIEATGSSDDGQLLSTNGVEYNVLDDFLNGVNAYIPMAGDTCTLHLNSFGWVAYIDNISAVTGTIGYLIKVSSDENHLNSDIKIKVLDSKGVIQIFDVQDKITLDDAFGKTRKCNSEDLDSNISGYRGLIEYVINDKEILTKMTIPIQDQTIERNTGRIRSVDKASDTAIVYLSPSTQFGGKYIMDNKTKIFKINETATDELKQYQVINLNSLSDGTAYMVKAYNKVFDSPYSDYIVVQDSSDYSMSPSLNKRFFIVTKVSNSVNGEGELCKKLYGYSVDTGAASQSTVIMSNNGAFDKMNDMVKSGAAYSVMPGDIIRYYSFKDNVENAEMIYRSEATYEGTTTKGVLAGTIGYYDSTVRGMTNPFAVGSNRSVSTTSNIFNSGEIRVLLGSVYNMVNNNIIKYTSQDLNANIYDPNDTRYCVESIKLPTNFTTITYSNGNIKVEIGSINDIKTYKQAGKDCSRVIVNTRAGRIEKVFIINGLAEN